MMGVKDYVHWCTFHILVLHKTPLAAKTNTEFVFTTFHLQFTSWKCGGLVFTRWMKVISGFNMLT